MPRPASPASSSSSSTSLLLLLLLLPCLPHSPAVHAQELFRPRHTTYNTFIDGRGLFVGGGKAQGETAAIVQTFMIDLSTNWTTSSPKYETLADGFSVVGASSTISPDNKLWLVSYRTQVYAYSFEKRTWDPYLELSNGDGDIRGSGAVTDVENGLVYFVDAFPNNMMRIITAGPSYDKVATPSQLNGAYFYSAAWSAYSQKVYFLGGMTENRVLQSWKAFSYSSTEGWIDLSTSMKGTVPTFRYEGCFVPAYDGTKMVFFGGFNESNIAFADIFVLDVATLTWTKGPSASANDRRANSACAASGDYFISWCGKHDTEFGTETVNSTLSYDLKANLWTTTYVAPLPSATRTPRNASLPSPTSSRSPSTIKPDDSVANSPSQVAVIVGGVLGGIAVAIAAVGFLLFRVRGKRSRNSIKNTVEPPLTGNNDPSSPGTKSPRNPHFASLIHNPSSDGGVPSQRGPQERISQQLWFQKDIPSPPHSPVPISGSFHPFSYPLSHPSPTHAPQEGSMDTLWINEGPHNPHEIVKGRFMYQDGLSDYSDFSPMTVPSYEDKGSYKDTDLILMNQVEDSRMYRSQ
ncbi:MAG: hypothetical protein J3Q66DRAFT_367791 [Benniella sp.]|nr:MAG: hypothetical protein J3Q66DRAFT_367791 [Benniella sp.]